MGRMLRYFLLLAALTGPVAAQEGPAGVVRQQLDAFLADDFERAFTFASPMIQNMFRNPQNFGAMVRNGYPMVWRPADVAFGPAVPRGDTVLQTVIITDGQGTVHALEYEMIPDGAGWRINGVRFLRAPEVGA